MSLLEGHTLAQAALPVWACPIMVGTALDASHWLDWGTHTRDIEGTGWVWTEQHLPGGSHLRPRGQRSPVLIFTLLLFSRFFISGCSIDKFNDAE